MPYLAHFGLKEHPFTLTPNTNQYFPIDKHVEIIQSIQFGIARGIFSAWLGIGALSTCSAPEVIFGNLAARTENMRIGHYVGGVGTVLRLLRTKLD